LVALLALLVLAGVAAPRLPLPAGVVVVAVVDLVGAAFDAVFFCVPCQQKT